MFCKNCGNQLPDYAAFCSRCGRNVAQKYVNASIKVSERSKTATLLLSIFLGYYGVHRFYVGKIATGLLWFFTFGVFGIGWIVDIILIAANEFYDSNGGRILDNHKITANEFYDSNEVRIVANYNNEPIENQNTKSLTIAEDSSYKNDVPVYRPLVYRYNSITHLSVTEISEPNTFVAVDLETTGLNPRCDEIIQIGAIKYEKGVETDRFMSYIKPTIPIPPQASKINNIYDYTVANAPDIKSVLRNFIDFIDNYTLIAHNASFDMKFLQTHLSYNDIELIENDVLDTLQTARCFLTLPNYKLTTIREHYNLDVTMHEAVADCSVCATIYLDYLDFIKPKFDEITDDIYKCFLVGHSDDIDNWYNNIDNMCRLNGGRCYKTKAKSAKYAIIIPKTFQVSYTVDGYRDDGYKVTNLENALEYMSKVKESIITEE